MVVNLMLCIPVLLLVGGFRYVSRCCVSSIEFTPPSLYQFYALLRNTTTIERLEKNKVATLVRRGRIGEVRSIDFIFGMNLITLIRGQIKFPYVRRLHPS